MNRERTGRSARFMATILAMAAITACTGLTANPQPIVPLRVVSVAPDLLAFHRQAAGRDGVQRAILFRKLILEKHPEIYGPVLSKPSDAALVRHVEKITRLLPTMLRLEPLLLREIERGNSRIAAITGTSHAAHPPIYLITSFLSFDGQVRPVGGSSIVMFGLDAVAGSNGGNLQPDLAPLVTHELFHGQHYSANAPLREMAKGYFGPGGLPPLHGSVWFEGLATCVSRMAVPQAELSDILLSEHLANANENTIRSVASELLTKRDSREMSDVGRYFFKGGSGGAVPDRAGLLGMLVADQVLMKMPLADAMRLNGEALRSEMKIGLGRIASGVGTDVSETCLSTQTQ